MTLLPENVKNPGKTYFNQFTPFCFRGIKPSATATDKAIRTLNLRTTKRIKLRHANNRKTQIKPEFLQKKNLNQTLSYSIYVLIGGKSGIRSATLFLFICFRLTPLILLSFLLFLCRYHAQGNSFA